MKILWTGTCPEPDCLCVYTMQCNDCTEDYIKKFVMKCPCCDNVEPEEGDHPVVMVAEVLN